MAMRRLPAARRAGSGIGRDRRAISCVHVHDCTGGHCRHRRLHRLGIEPRTRRFRDQPPRNQRTPSTHSPDSFQVIRYTMSGGSAGSATAASGSSFA